ncbi:hypothetical protein GZH53_08610 [Flavihumibacter sp. R14]|nr:hypothetical protein [Flavihumibacter soli]
MPRKLVYLLLCLSLAGYLVTCYFIQRENFALLISVYSSLFILYFWLLALKQEISLRTAITTGLIFRFVLLFSFPALSDDIYRFLWDGRLYQTGINPFDFKPAELISQSTDAYLKQLYPYLNSPDYYSVYPQLLQYIFRLATEAGGDSIIKATIILKSVIFLFECGSVYLVIRLLRLKKLDERGVFIYLFNPLVIIELTGNIHFEAVMIFFVLLTALLVHNKQFLAAAFPLAMAIQAKLLPLITIPLLIKKFGIAKTALFGSLCLFILWLSSPLLWTNTGRYFHFFSSLQLYYGKFEFNGSIYSLFSAIGWWFAGYNPIWWVSKIMLLITLAPFAIIYKRRPGFLKGFFWLMTAYLLCSAVVHPWYLAILIALSPFVNYRFPLAWTALAPLTYITYSVLPYQQNYWFVALEYLTVAAVLLYEMRTNLIGSVLPVRVAGNLKDA